MLSMDAVSFLHNGYIVSDIMLFKTYFLLCVKVNMVFWNYQADSSLPRFCVFSDDPFHSSISSHLNFVTQYAPHEMHVCNYDHQFSIISLCVNGKAAGRDH